MVSKKALGVVAIRMDGRTEMASDLCIVFESYGICQWFSAHGAPSITPVSHIIYAILRVKSCCCTMRSGCEVSFCDRNTGCMNDLHRYLTRTAKFWQIQKHTEKC